MVEVDIMSLEDIQKGLKDKRLHMVAKTTGLSYPTLKSIIDDVSPNPTRKTMLKITEYLRNIK